MKNAQIQFAWSIAWDSDDWNNWGYNLLLIAKANPNRALTVALNLYSTFHFYLLFKLYKTKYDSTKISFLWLWKTY